MATTPPPTPTAPASGGQTAQPLWRADMEESSLADWYFPEAAEIGWHGGGEYDSGNGDSDVSSAFAHTGRQSARLTLSDGSGGTRLFRWKELREYRTTTQSVWFYFPRTFTPLRTATSPPWWNILQVMSRNTNNEVRPFWHLDVQNTPTGDMRLDLVWWQQTIEGPRPGQSGYARYRQSVATLPVGRWFQIKTQLVESNQFDGAFRVWQDGQLLFDMSGVRTSYANCKFNSWCASNEWSVNNYSDGVGPGPGPISIYADDAEIAAG